MSPAYPHPQGFPGAYSDDASGAARQADDDIDKLIRMAEAGIKPPKGEPEAEAEVKPEVKPAAEPEKKKKEKGQVKMMYSDNDLSPEERMAQMPRYAFVPGKAESVSVGA